MSNKAADEAKGGGELEELDQIKAPFGVIEAIELYEAAMPYYAAAAARLAPVWRRSSTRSTSNCLLL